MRRLTGLLLLSLLCASCSAIKNKPFPQSGVSKELAERRVELLSDIQYNLHFKIPADKNTAIQLQERIVFRLVKSREPLVLDFKERTDLIHTLTVNNKKIKIEHVNEHLIISNKYLLAGINRIELTLTAGEKGLNRNSDYLYTLFVPDKARSVFPCFDQPSLKAKFNLTLTVPSSWEAIANAFALDSLVSGDYKTIKYDSSDLLSTYLFSFSAGKFKKVTEDGSSFLYRETDSLKINNSVTEIFKAHKHALSFMEEYAQIPFPFKKMGYVAIPDFQFGGMEHPGAIEYKASMLFLDRSATKDQLTARASLISHETAHMWFGDLVTMKWFDDVWMKEVFANFMADKVSEKLSSKEEFSLKFLIDHYPAAYGVDRTAGSNPIRQNLVNLQDAASLYGNIIYHKAPVVMRQLEHLMGEEPFRLGLQEYLKTFAYKNANWEDLILILQKYAKRDLQEWNKAWIYSTGRPVLDYHLSLEQGKITAFHIVQQHESGSKVILPQQLKVQFYYSDHSKEFTVNMDQPDVSIQTAIGLNEPLLILFNSDAEAYGIMPVDLKHIGNLNQINTAVKRASFYINMYENVLQGRYLKPAELLQLFSMQLRSEREELNIKLLSSYISTLYWTFSTPERRNVASSQLEESIWSSMERVKDVNQKKLLLKAYQDVFLSPLAYKRLYAIWENQVPPIGMVLTEDDYTALSYSLVLRNGDTSILETQLKRIVDPDRRKRFIFIMPSLSPLESVRDSVFASLKDRKNRTKETWIVSVLNNLHHPLRQESSEKYIPESLNLLTEISATGDIFFPQSWLQATLSGYQSKSAYEMVHGFLDANPDLPARLKLKVLQAVDNVDRAGKLAHTGSLKALHP